MTTEPTREITIAFDGACRGNPGPGGYGAILLNTRTNAEKIVQGREPSATTNNRMELSAAIEASAQAPREAAHPCRAGREAGANLTVIGSGSLLPCT